MCIRDSKLLVTLEENVKSGGFGERVLDLVNTERLKTNVLINALPDEYVEHGNVDILKRESGIDQETLFKKILSEYVGL